ncbi:hypothetical protein HY310_02105, partial [Candidatus Microgenomates bacterium]|nr:hypothetical protein [Candidatus Microgenomates bacterium]
MPKNPATGIKKLTVAPRQHYAEDQDYYYLINIARQSGYWYVEYAMELASGTKISKITALSNDLALATEAPTGQIRIEAPIPG